MLLVTNLSEETFSCYQEVIFNMTPKGWVELIEQHLDHVTHLHARKQVLLLRGKLLSHDHTVFSINLFNNPKLFKLHI